jgi:hypothetical protein
VVVSDTLEVRSTPTLVPSIFVIAVAWQVWRFFVTKLSLCRPWKDVDEAKVDCVWNVMAHAQKPDFVFQRNRRVHLNRRGLQFSRLLAAELCASAVVMLDTPCSEVVWRVLATHSIHQFPLHFPSRASPCTITIKLYSTAHAVNIVQQFGVTTGWAALLQHWNRVTAMYSQFAETLKLLAFSLFPCLITYFPEECRSLYSALFLTRLRRSSLSSLQWLACPAIQHSSLHSSLYLLCTSKAQRKSLRVGGSGTIFQIWLSYFWS